MGGAVTKWTMTYEAPANGSSPYELPQPPSMEGLPEEVHAYCAQLTNMISLLLEELKELKGRLSKNSSNSGKPPSSDREGKTPKTKSQRGKSGKRPGGQSGRKGKNLQSVDNPDHIVHHFPESCQSCGHALDAVEARCAESRQVFEMPEPKLEVTEHRVYETSCSCCGCKSKASFPTGIEAHTQYGHHARALMAYLHNQHLIPVERVSRLFQDLFGYTVSPGTITQVNIRLFDHLESFEKALQVHLLASTLLHFDETGVRCNKKLQWVHVASSAKATLYHTHLKRGQEGMEAGGILGLFQGVGVHDHLHSYFAYPEMRHALCNAHHLRELTFIDEQEKEPWAIKLKKILLQMKEETEAYRHEGTVPEETVNRLTKEYASIVLEGFLYHCQLPPLPKNKRGRRKQRPGKNLLVRLIDDRQCVLRFLNDLSVPFTNNQAERDLRMIKVQQKVSGCFRTPTGATMFCRIRSCISSVRKQGWNILKTLATALSNPNLLPSLS